jgi:hypothetical protein
MVLDNWSCCPECKFPALYSHFKAQLARSPQCPMCYVKLEEHQVTQIQDPRNLLADNAERLETEQVKGPEAPGSSATDGQAPPATSGGGGGTDDVFSPSYVDENGGRTRSRDNLGGEAARKFARPTQGQEEEDDAF